jgi:intein-encoded DNA endonuclease-like protein
MYTKKYGKKFSDKKINFYYYKKKKKFVTQSRTGLQIYEGHDDQLNRPGPMA